MVRSTFDRKRYPPGQGPGLVTVPLNAGRIFLADILEPTTEGHFPFFELAPELRTRIYEMALSFPDLCIEDLLGCKRYRYEVYASKRENDPDDGNYACDQRMTYLLCFAFGVQTNL